MFIDPEQYSSASTHELLAAAGLAQIGKDHRWLRALLARGDAIVPDLLDAMADEFIDIDDDVLAIARALRSPAGAPVLVGYASECEEEFPDELVSAFRELGEAAVEPLLELREEMEDPWEVDSVLAALGVRDPRILAVLLEELEQSPVDAAISLSMYGDPAARLALIQARDSVEAGWDRDQIEGAIQTLDNPQPPEPPAPYDIWADYPAEALPWFDGMEAGELVEFLASPLASYRAEALRSLGAVAMGLAPELRDRVLEMARTDPDPDVRGGAWEALEMNLDEPAIHRAMAERLEAPDTPPLERAGAAFSFASHGGGPDLSRWLLDLHTRPETRASALFAMRLTEDRRYGTYFVQYLDDPDPDVRLAAVRGIGTFEISPAAGRLREFFQDDDLRTDALGAYAEAAPAPLSRAGMFDLLDQIEDLAGELSEEEERFVKSSIDERLERRGRPPMFLPDAVEEEDDDEDEDEDEEEEEEDVEDIEEEPAAPYVAPPKIGRNQPCPCGSGKKYKKCCGR